jgi:hypothetical protein
MSHRNVNRSLFATTGVAAIVVIRRRSLADLPLPHSDFVARLTAQVQADPRLAALLIAGSYVQGGFDQYSDLDFTLVVADGAHAEVMVSARPFAMAMGGLINAFTGEHVGEPRLLVCLYGPPLLHVDLKFITTDDLAALVEKPKILFARDAADIAARIEAARIAWPNRPPDWFEARIWIWLHYATAKLGRGEFHEAVALLGYLREQILGPMLHRRAGRDQRGLRRIEQAGVDPEDRLAATLCAPHAAAIQAAIRAAIALYLDLRADSPPAQASPGMPDALHAELAVRP